MTRSAYHSRTGATKAGPRPVRTGRVRRRSALDALRLRRRDAAAVELMKMTLTDVLIVGVPAARRAEPPVDPVGCSRR
jgi:hypothetical protein